MVILRIRSAVFRIAGRAFVESSAPRKARLAAGCLLLGTAFALGQGFPNIPRTPGELLTPLLAPNQGRTALVAYHNGWLYTVPEIPASQPGSDHLVRRWDISDLSDVRVAEVYEETDHPVMAHGYLKIGEYLALGDNWPAETPFSFRAVSPGVNLRTQTPGLEGPWDRGNLFQPWHINTYWSYNPDEIDDLAVLRKDGNVLATWDHIGETGVIGHPFIVGDLLIFASDQSRTGVATYDIGDPANPQLLDVLKTGGPGGYWPELWGGAGKLYIVFPYREPVPGIRVVDTTDPSDLRLVADVQLPGAPAMYAQFQDEFAFLGSHKVDMRTVTSVLRLDAEGESIDTSQFLLPVGNLLATGGLGPNQGLAIWAHQAAPDTRGPSVGYHIPRAGETEYPRGAPITLLIHETLESSTIEVGTSLIVRPLGGDPIPGKAVFAFNDILTFTPDADLLPDTTYEVVIPGGGIEDVSGNGIEAYSFAFSTGPTVSGNRPPAVTSLTHSPYPAAPGETVSFEAAATDPDGDDLEYRFDFGDGSDPTPWSATDTASRAYPGIGHFPAKVQVRDTEGAVTSRVATVTITNRTSSLPPPRSSDVVCDPVRRLLWTVNPDNDSVTALDADTLAKVFETKVGDHPRSLALDGNGNAWIPCRDGDRIDIVSPAGAWIDSLSLDYGDAPFAVVASPDRSRAYVSLSGPGELVAYNLSTRTKIGRVDVGPTPRALAMTPDGASVFVARFLSAENHGEVREIDTASLAVARTLRLDKLGGDGHRDGTADGKGTPNYLSGLAVSPEGDRLLVTSNKMNSDKGILTGPDLDQDNSVRNIVTMIDLDSGAVLQSIDIDNSDSASAVTYSPLGDYFFVALQGNNHIVVFDRYAVEQSAGLGGFLSRQTAGEAPRGLCVDPQSGRLFVKNYLGRDVTVFEMAEFYGSGAADFPRSSHSTVSSESLPGEILRGKKIFYHAGDARMSGEGYLSCATCHLDGGHDGRTWDFTGRGEGLRNTTALTGRSGTGHGNVHWTGNFDEIQDFEHDIRGAFGGTGFLDDADFATADTPGGAPKAGLDPDLDALAAYVSSLDHGSIPKSPHRARDGDLTTAGFGGDEIFVSEGCATCHAGREMTDGLLHDVGSIRTTSGKRLGEELPGIRTPTLRGLWETAPYLHDGSARTLEDVFVVAGGETIQAESGIATGNAEIVTEWTHLNNDETVRGGGYAHVVEGGRLRLENVDGGSGGSGAVEIRYSSGYTSGTLVVSVNGVPHEATVSPTGNVPDWRFVNWIPVRIEGVSWNAGAANTVEIHVSDPPWLPVGIDEVTVTPPDRLALAEPHRKVLALAPETRGRLLSWLEQLDGSPLESPPRIDSPDRSTLTIDSLGRPSLSWSFVPGADAYRIYRGSDGRFEEASLLAETSSTSHVDAGTRAGETWFYWIVATDSGGESIPDSPLRHVAGPALPDLLLGRSRSELIGDDIRGTRQVFRMGLERLRKTTALLAVQNDGHPDELSMVASRGNRQVRVRYFTYGSDRRNVTSSMIGGSLVLPAAPNGSTDRFLVKLKPTARFRHSSLVSTVRSRSAPSALDRGRILLQFP